MRGQNKIITQRRIVAVLLCFSLFAGYLLVNIFRLDYIKYDYYREKTYDQVTTSSTLKAKRGNIYDSNLNLLAKSDTVWRIFTSTRDIKNASKRDGKDYAKIISEGLAHILSMDAERLYNKITMSNVLDVTMKKEASQNEYNQVIEFINQTGLNNLIFTETNSKIGIVTIRIISPILTYGEFSAFNYISSGFRSFCLNCSATSKPSL